MKPYLIVDNRKYIVTTVNTIEEGTNEIKSFHDEEYFTTLDNVVDFRKQLINPAQQQQAIERIEKRIEAIEEIQISLAQDFMEGAIRKDVTHVTFQQLKKEYKINIQRVNSLYDALKMIAKDGHPHD